VLESQYLLDLFTAHLLLS